MRKLSSPLALLFAAAALAACADSATEPPLAPLAQAGPAAHEGRLTFHYSGDASGTYHARGPVPANLTVPENFAFGVEFRDTEPVTYAVYGFHVEEGTTTGERVFLFVYGEPAPGDEVPSCFATFGEAPCFDVILITGYDPTTPTTDPGQVTWVATGGTLRVARLTEDRFAGSFSATATNTAQTAQITIQGGSFDVPIAYRFF